MGQLDPKQVTGLASSYYHIGALRIVPVPDGSVMMLVSTLGLVNEGTIINSGSIVEMKPLTGATSGVSGLQVGGSASSLALALALNGGTASTTGQNIAYGGNANSNAPQ